MKKLIALLLMAGMLCSFVPTAFAAAALEATVAIDGNRVSITVTHNDVPNDMVTILIYQTTGRIGYLDQAALAGGTHVFTFTLDDGVYYGSVQSQSGERVQITEFTVRNPAGSDRTDKEKKPLPPPEILNPVTTPEEATTTPLEGKVNDKAVLSTIVSNEKGSKVQEIKVDEQALVAAIDSLVKTVGETAKALGLSADEMAAPVLLINAPMAQNVSAAAVNIPSKAVGRLAQNNVTLKVDLADAALQIPAEALQGIFGSGDYTITMQKIDGQEVVKNAVNGDGLTPTGQAMELTFKVKGKARVELKLNREADEDLVGVYYLAEEANQLIFMGGKIKGDRVVFETPHNSKYFVMEYDKEFADVKGDAWYYKFVKSMAAKHVISGVTAAAFVPDKNVTRAEFAKMLVETLGLEKQTYRNLFVDVKNGQWYADYIQTAYQAGIVSGIGDGTFAPDKEITRQEMFAMIGRILKNKADNTVLAQFADRSELADWALESAAKAVQAKIIAGSNGKLDPKGKTTRAQAAKVMYELFNR